jgi:hypothetical protein
MNDLYVLETISEILVPSCEKKIERNISQISNPGQ